MSETNLKLRDSAVPFISWHQQDNLLTTTSLKYYTCPVVDSGNVIEAYLTLFLPVATPVSVTVAIGEFGTDGVNPSSAYTSIDRAASHKRLTGLDSAIASVAGMLMLDGINLLLEAAKFNEHGFVLQLQFSRALTVQEGFLLNERLLINCSSEVGLI